MGNIHTPDIEKAVMLYYSKPEISYTDIADLFGASKSKARLMKNEVLKEMVKREVKVWMPHTVSTKVAFELWGIDIKDYEERLRKIRYIERRTSNEAKTTV